MKEKSPLIAGTMLPPQENILIDGLDPFDPNLTQEEQGRIIAAVNNNPFIYYQLIMATQLRQVNASKVESK